LATLFYLTFSLPRTIFARLKLNAGENSEIQLLYTLRSISYIVDLFTIHF